LYSWGTSQYGERGNGESSLNFSPVRMDNLTTWSTVADGNSWGIALKTNGTLWAYGEGGLGSLGNGSSAAVSSPVQIGALTNWSKVFAPFGGYNSFSIKTDNTLWVWGYNQFGALGIGNETLTNSPVQLGANTWTTVAPADSFTLAIRSNGSLWAWGYNLYGQLGDNSITDRSSPVQVGALTSWTKIAAGGQSFSLAIRSGQLWSWGLNNRGQLGTNEGNIQRSSPVQVGALSDWAEISAGNAHVIALKTGGTLWAWGENDEGQIGDGTYTNRSSPVQIGSLTNWSKVIATNKASYAIKTDGTLWAWGFSGGSGILGNGKTGPSSGGGINSPIQIGSATNWSTMTAGQGNRHAINSSGEMYVWGTNGQGSSGTGLNFFGARPSPIQIGSLEWIRRAGGNAISLGIKDDGTLWAWGDGRQGQLGNNRVVDQYIVPTQIGSGTDWAEVFAFSESGCLAVKSNGTLWAWGGNGSGELGRGNTTSISSPAQVGALTDWKYVAGGAVHALAVKANGSLWSWGNGSLGRLGHNNVTSLSSPVQVGALTDWAQASGGGAFSVAVKTNGTIWSWGDNNAGQLGHNDWGSGARRSSPVQIGALTNWQQVTTGNDFCVAVKTDGTLWSWGQNSSGQLGRNTIVSISSPAQVGALTDWVAAVSGADCTVAVRSNGTLWAWGSNAYGQVGDGTTTSRSSPVQIGSLTNWIKVSNSQVSSRMVGAFSE
jgi:alpha-tubulin suppressor-like RCC1 family protein